MDARVYAGSFRRTLQRLRECASITTSKIKLLSANEAKLTLPCLRYLRPAALNIVSFETSSSLFSLSQRPTFLQSTTLSKVAWSGTPSLNIELIALLARSSLG